MTSSFYLMANTKKQLLLFILVKKQKYKRKCRAPPGGDVADSEKYSSEGTTTLHINRVLTTVANRQTEAKRIGSRMQYTLSR